MDPADLREKAQTRRRWAEALPRNDPERFYLLELHDDLLACAVRLERVTKPGARRKGIQRARRQKGQLVDVPSQPRASLLALSDF
jgi:hypothetical protein